MLKICMVVHVLYYYDARVRRYAEALADAGASVDVVCPQGVKPQRTEDRAGIRVFTIPTRHARQGHGRYVFEYGKAFPLYSLWLLWLYLKNRYHVIHVHNMPDFLVFSALMPRLLGAKVVLDIHDPMPELYMSKYKVQADSGLVRLMQFEEALSANFANAVITANCNFKENLIKRGIPSSKVTVVNNLPDPKVFDRSRFANQGLPESKFFTLIYPGTIAPRYSLDVAIRALPLLAQRIPNIRLLIIGPHKEHVSDLSALAEQLGVSSFLEIRPGVSLEEVAQQIRQADVGIYTALPDPHMSIAMPGKVLEYAVMGIPIVTSRLRVLEQVFDDSSVMFFKPGDSAEFAQHVIELYESPKLREKLVENTDRNFVNAHPWKGEQREYFATLNHLLAQGSRLAIPNSD